MGVLFAAALWLRLGQQHGGLLYPDGYQYLLMARGIAEHLRPTTVLGPGGDVFVPNADAAAKPFFPALVALVHAGGLSWLGAARLVTAAAAAAAVVLTGLLTVRLSGSRLAGAAAALLVLASPTTVFWSGFAGPDPLAQALALGAALALVDRRFLLGGVLAGCAGTTRPELLAVVAAGALAAALDKRRRGGAAKATCACAVTVAVVLGVLRPPLEMPERHFLLVVPLAVAAVGLTAAAPQRWRLAAAGAAVLALCGAAASGAAPGAAALWSDDWPLLVLGGGGLVLALLDEARRDAALKILGAGALLAGVYWLKNPELERYPALLLPAVALLAGLGFAALPRRRQLVAAGAVGLALIALALRTPLRTDGPDVFSAVAVKLSPSLSPDEPLLSAAPDAYGFLLPSQTVRTMRPGGRGLIVLDPAQRLYAPELDARGKVLVRIENDGFVRPDGEIDVEDTLLVAGRVERGSAPARRTAAAGRLGSKQVRLDRNIRRLDESDGDA